MREQEPCRRSFFADGLTLPRKKGASFAGVSGSLFGAIPLNHSGICAQNRAE